MNGALSSALGLSVGGGGGGSIGEKKRFGRLKRRRARLQRCLWSALVLAVALIILAAVLGVDVSGAGGGGRIEAVEALEAARVLRPVGGGGGSGGEGSESIVASPADAAALRARAESQAFVVSSEGDGATGGGSLRCKNTRQGRRLIADDRGHVCTRFDFDSFTGCCRTRGNASASGFERFSCKTCQRRACCREYEFCVACCIHPLRSKGMLRAINSRNATILEVCMHQCRVTSAVVVHENNYRTEFKHCFDKLLGKLIRMPPVLPTTGAPGRTCLQVCEDEGLVCEKRYFKDVNTCQALFRAFPCEAGCRKQTGGDLPAYVVATAVSQYSPATCLVNSQGIPKTKKDAKKVSSCKSKFMVKKGQSATQRLCPCRATSDNWELQEAEPPLPKPPKSMNKAAIVTAKQLAAKLRRRGYSQRAKR